MIKKVFGQKKLNLDKIKIPKSAQDIIDVDVIYKDGIFQMGHKYSKTYKFKDINFSNASKENKEGIFLDYSDLLNSFDSSVMIKISINNRKLDINEFKENVLMPHMNDGLDHFRDEFNDVLLKNLEEIDGIKQEKYMTVTTDKNSIEEARIFFKRTTLELEKNFKNMGSECTALSTQERLKILHDFYRNGHEEEFYFKMEDFAKQGHHFKDAICPESPIFEHNHFKIGDKYGRVLYLKNYANFIKDDFVAELCSLNKSLMYSMDIVSIPRDVAVKLVNRKILGIETNIAKFTTSQNANNNFNSVPPYEMILQRNEVQELMDDLTVRDQKMMFGLITVVHLADSLEELDADTEALKSIARIYMCELSTLNFSSRQFDGICTVLPVGVNKLGIQRTLITESASIFIPFRAQEIMDKGGVYVGQNAVTNNMIMCNKANLQNPNSFVFGVPGSGKSFISKELIFSYALGTTDDILILDPEAEYSDLVKALHGEVLEFKTGSHCHINAMDLEEGYGESDNPIADKSQFIQTLLYQNSKHGITEKEQSIIDRCVTETYRRTDVSGEIPTLCTLRNILLEQPEQEAKDLALKMELFTIGNNNMFAQETNVERKGRITSFNIRNLQGQMKMLGLTVICDTIINRVNENWRNRRRTHIFYDEIHRLYTNPYTAEFLESAWRQFRKRNAYPTGITQNVSTLLKRESVRSMVQNSEFMIMMNQANDDRKDLQQMLGMSDEQLSHIKNAHEGCGLVRYGDSLVPFVNRFPIGTESYKLMSTKPDEVV